MSGFAAQRAVRVENLGPFAFRAANVTGEMGCVIQALRIIRVRGMQALADNLGAGHSFHEHHCRNLPTCLAPMHQITNLKPLHF